MVRSGKKRTHRLQVIQLNNDFVNLPVGKLLEHLLVFVLGSFPPGLLLLTSLLGTLILIHKVIVIAQIVLINIDVSQRSGDGLLGRRLEILEKALKRSCTVCCQLPSQQLKSFPFFEALLTLLRRILNRGAIL